MFQVAVSNHMFSDEVKLNYFHCTLIYRSDHWVPWPLTQFSQQKLTLLSVAMQYNTRDVTVQIGFSFSAYKNCELWRWGSTTWRAWTAWEWRWGRGLATLVRDSVHGYNHDHGHIMILWPPWIIKDGHFLISSKSERIKDCRFKKTFNLPCF